MQQWEIPPPTYRRLKKMFLDLRYQPRKTLTDTLDYLRGFNDDDKRDLHEITRAYIELNMPKNTISIKIPKDAIIGYQAFRDYTGLEEVVISEGVYISHNAFLGCTRLVQLVIPKDAFIGSEAFCGCIGLKEVVIHEGARIGSYAFRDSTSLTKLVIPEGVRIGGCAFLGCTGLTELVIPEGAIINWYAFSDCTGLTELIIHKNAIISVYAFEGCTGLTKLVILEGTTINSSAFSSCTGLTEVIIHKGADVNGRAFQGCDNLSLIVVPDDFPRDNLPVGATIVTHTKHQEMNDFYSKYGFQDLELKDKIKIYDLCHSSDEVSHEDFEQLSHLSVVTMLNFIQAYSEIPSNIARGKKPLEWTMGKGFFDAHPDKDVSGMISKARDEGPNSQLQEYMSVKDWRKKTHPVSKRFNDNLFSSTREETGSEEKSKDGLEPGSTPGRSR